MKLKTIACHCLIISTLAIVGCSAKQSFEGRHSSTSNLTGADPTPTPTSGRNPGGGGDIAEGDTDGIRRAMTATAEEMAYCWSNDRLVCNADEVKLVLDMY